MMRTAHRDGLLVLALPMPFVMVWLSVRLLHCTQRLFLDKQTVNRKESLWRKEK